jgi:hypothetical protein
MVAAFVERNLAYTSTRVARLEAFATNAVCARGSSGVSDAAGGDGCAQHWTGYGVVAFVMRRISGAPIPRAHQAFYGLGWAATLLHRVTLSGFGPLMDVVWDERGGFTLPYTSWRTYLMGISADTRRLNRGALASALAEAASAALDAHAAALDSTAGSLLHGT